MHKMAFASLAAMALEPGAATLLAELSTSLARGAGTMQQYQQLCKHVLQEARTLLSSARLLDGRGSLRLALLALQPSEADVGLAGTRRPHRRRRIDPS